MSQSHAFEIITVGGVRDHRGRDARSWLYKDDHPRHIDRYIDFFGSGRTRTILADPCGECLLERHP
jgi:hypothetical protein